uniref:DIX domain-containing protein n=1 Tax=Trieres chinensis TaxID=1514140 RepID=A0A7S1Z6D0_TRICV|mmetsp:Transcript_18366/g.37218  ORF Transcript_18366/g.37218 Transcript_18366/m.37218 type:complete len:307 (+) Transcript_18366:79-999(+)|eukprot:CAMPEP_0183300400 /NCGR_PEP_ID=MMETSP0160_2-20130417/6844_1 /TAXON_ID=2839 ORGANISM="Odontella Sinensis, Strain Grunow 1884" /NCGR_SAMPLE_ID=MMETSP0160_2 /ASSEMBLY_ACC=CAM_ASM_000250 /LENGTH=306 /DNA_ID=CAMNT_0025462811 /DNA_START=76 /DNA_END=996 /DNA_ORIENTATION=-
MTTIRYFLPEDGDTESHPNVFLAPKSAHGLPPTLGAIKSAFPLPGQYHFRFKSPLVPGGDREKGGLAVWLDCVEDDQPVGVWRNSIIAKVTRISFSDDEDDEDFGRHRSMNGGHVEPAYQAPATQAPVRPQASPAPPAPPQPATEPTLDIFDHPTPNSAPPSHPGSTHSSTGNLLDGLDDAHKPAPKAAPGSANSLLDFTDSHGGHSAASIASPPTSGIHNDLMGLTSAPVPQPAAAPTPQTHYAPQQATAPAPQQQPMRRSPVPQQMAGGPSRAPPNRANSGPNTFENFSQQRAPPGPFGDLQWS